MDNLVSSLNDNDNPESSKYVVTNIINDKYAVIQMPYKLITSAEGDQLYNILDDPSEKLNIASQNHEIVLELKNILSQWQFGENRSTDFSSSKDPDLFGGEEDRIPWIEKVLKMLTLNKFIKFSSILIIVNSCSSGSGSSNETSSPELVISYSNLNNLKSYELVNFNINSNLNCEFNISSSDIYWIKTTNNRDFTFRAPATMQISEIKDLTIASISSSESL